jgi:uncharacterized protein
MIETPTVSPMTEPTSPLPDPNAAGGVLTRVRKHLSARDRAAEDKTWALVAHFGGAAGTLVTAGVGGWIAPLITLLAKGNQSPTVRPHAVNALNFQLLWSIIGVLAWSISWRLPAYLPVLAVTIIGVAFGVLGGLRANEDRPYTYPISASLIR